MINLPHSGQALEIPLGLGIPNDIDMACHGIDKAWLDWALLDNAST